MSKVFVLREHALLSSHKSTLRFGDDNEIVIPLCVIDEIKATRNQSFEKGRIARDLLEYINSFPVGQLLSEKGARQANGSKLRISKAYGDIKFGMENLTNSEKRTLQICIGIRDKEGKEVILVTNNLSLQLKAKALSIKAESLKDEVFPRFSEQYTGRMEILVSEDVINSFYKNGFIQLNMVKDSIPQNEEVYENEFFVMKSYSGKSAIGKFTNGIIKELEYQNVYPYGVKAKNVGQRFMLEALLDDNIPLVIIKGSAGTGKTFCALAVGLEKTFNMDIYPRKMLVTRSVTATEDYGYLPGDINEKISPYLAGIKDNLDILSEETYSKKEYSKDYCVEKPKRDRGEYFFERGIVKIQALGLVRGRTIYQTYFIVDETQNVDPDIIKTIVTRSGQGSKFIFLGDPTQIDNPNLTERYNGLVYLSEKMKGKSLCAQVTLPDEESVRSDLARLAAQIL